MAFDINLAEKKIKMNIPVSSRCTYLSVAALWIIRYHTSILRSGSVFDF